MGWIHDVDDTYHEAFLAPAFEDGTRGIGVSTGKTSQAGQIIIGIEYVGERGAITDELYATRPAATAIGWRIECHCTLGPGQRPATWLSDLLPRVPSTALEDLEIGRFYATDEDVEHLGDLEKYEDAARAIWRRHHINPADSLASITAARRKVTEAEQVLDLAVARARATGQTWEAIGRAAGITRQSAHARWA